MSVRSKSTNIYLHALIKELRNIAREHKAKIWKTIADFLERPRRRRIHVNVSKINRLTNSNDTVVVPGKVLGAGDIDHPVTVAAFSFSESAKEKILSKGGSAITINELAKKNPKGSNVKIII